MNIEILIVVGIILVVGFFAYNRNKNKFKKNYSPVLLHPVHGGGTCDNPDWLYVRTEVLKSLKESGNTTGAAEYEAYAFNDTMDANTRSHYERHGATYPAHISPCR